MKIQENQEGLDYNATRLFLVYADGDNT